MNKKLNKKLNKIFIFIAIIFIIIFSIYQFSLFGISGNIISDMENEDYKTFYTFGPNGMYYDAVIGGGIDRDYYSAYFETDLLITQNKLISVIPIYSGDSIIGTTFFIKLDNKGYSFERMIEENGQESIIKLSDGSSLRYTFDDGWRAIERGYKPGLNEEEQIDTFSYGESEISSGDSLIAKWRDGSTSLFQTDTEGNIIFAATDNNELTPNNYEPSSDRTYDAVSALESINFESGDYFNLEPLSADLDLDEEGCQDIEEWSWGKINYLTLGDCSVIGGVIEIYGADGNNEKINFININPGFESQEFIYMEEEFANAGVSEFNLGVYGNSFLDEEEQCDDGNNICGDGCCLGELEHACSEVSPAFLYFEDSLLLDSDPLEKKSTDQIFNFINELKNKEDPLTECSYNSIADGSCPSEEFWSCPPKGRMWQGMQCEPYLEKEISIDVGREKCEEFGEEKGSFIVKNKEDQSYEKILEQISKLVKEKKSSLKCSDLCTEKEISFDLSETESKKGYLVNYEIYCTKADSPKRVKAQLYARKFCFEAGSIS